MLCDNWLWLLPFDLFLLNWNTLCLLHHPGQLSSPVYFKYLNGGNYALHVAVFVLVLFLLLLSESELLADALFDSLDVIEFLDLVADLLVQLFGEG